MSRNGHLILVFICGEDGGERGLGVESCLAFVVARCHEKANVDHWSKKEEVDLNRRSCLLTKEVSELSIHPPTHLCTYGLRDRHAGRHADVHIQRYICPNTYLSFATIQLTNHPPTQLICLDFFLFLCNF